MTERDRYLRGIARQEQERLNRERRRHAYPLRSRLVRASLWGVGLLLAGVATYFLVDWLTAGPPPAGVP